MFEHLDDAGLRTACTTYLIYRGRHRHEPSRDSPYVPAGRGGPVPALGVGPARAVLRRPVRHPQHRLLVDAGHAGPARPPRRAAWARSWWPTTRSTSCCSACPTTTRTRTARARRRSPRSIAEADARAGPPDGRRPAAPDAFLAEHAVIVMSDHSHDLVEAATNLSDALAGWRVLRARRTWTPRAPSWRSARARARRRSTCWTRTPARPTARARGRGPGRRAGRGSWWRGSRTGARWSARRAASCASRPAATATDDRAAGLGPGRATSRRST